MVAHESSGQRWASNGSDESYYQWLPSTWQYAERYAGVWFSADPFRASLRQQTFVFNVYEPAHRLAWPVTVPECGG